MDTIQKTHPWITFELNMERVDFNIWIQLGQVKATCEYISGIPLHPSVQIYLHSVFLAKGVHATTAIEGNTLSEEQVQERINGKLKLPESQEYLGIEVDNIIYGCNEIKQAVMSGSAMVIDYHSILEYNKIVLTNLSINDGVPGEIRKHSVGVGRYLAPPASDCEHLLKKLCEWLNHESFLSPEQSMVFGMIRAAMAHIYIEWIHPFADGNGRTARLVEFFILLSHGFPSSTAHLLSNHYNKTRTEYYRQLDYSSKSGGDIIPFLKYAVTGIVDGLKDQVMTIQHEQIRITWRDFVYDNFKEKIGIASDRQRKLILDISQNPNTAYARKDIRHISPRIAEMYSGKTDITIKRDLNELIKMKLLKWEKGKYSSNWYRILAFMPERKRTEQKKS